MHAQKRTCAFRLPHALAAEATAARPQSMSKFFTGLRPPTFVQSDRDGLTCGLMRRLAGRAPSLEESRALSLSEAYECGPP